MMDCVVSEELFNDRNGHTCFLCYCCVSPCMPELAATFIRLLFYFIFFAHFTSNKCYPRMLSCIRFLTLRNDAVCGGCCWYCYSGGASTCSNPGERITLQYTDKSFPQAHTHVAPLLWEYSGGCVLNTALVKMPTARPGVACVWGRAGTGQWCAGFSEGSRFRRRVIFSVTLKWPWRHPHTVHHHTGPSIYFHTWSLLANPGCRREDSLWLSEVWRGKKLLDP